MIFKNNESMKNYILINNKKMNEKFEIKTPKPCKNSSESSSFKSSSSNSQQNLIETETESEKLNRISLNNALISNNYSYAFKKIENNISLFCTNIQQLRDYSLFLGSKLDDKEKGSEIDKIILETADSIAETFYLINIIKNFEYSNKQTKIQNITKANALEDECHKYKKMFDDLTDKIKQQNITLIKQARNSYRYSNYSDFSGELHVGSQELTNNDNFANGKEFLDGIEIKRKQNDAIYKAAQKINRSLSRNNSKKIDLDLINNSPEIEKFNIGYNLNKKGSNDIKYESEGNYNENKSNNFKYDDRYSRTSKAFHEMEDQVYTALEGPKHNFFRRHWIFSSFIIVILIFILYYFFKK